MMAPRSQAGAAALLGLSIVLAPALASATTCKTVSACVFGTNAGTGYGVAGSAKSNYGVYGISSTNSGILGRTTHNATSVGNGKSGVSGYDSSTNEKGYNSGVYGFSAYGNGVHAKSTSGNGVYAETSSEYNAGVSGSAPSGYGVLAYGVIGVRASTPTGPSGLAMLADSPSDLGEGVVASGGGYGVVASIDTKTASSDPGAGLYARGLDPAPGILADTEVLETDTVSHQDTLDVIASNTGAGVSIGSYSGTPLTLAANGQLLMTASNYDADVMSLDTSGNLILAGKLTQKGSPAIVSQRADGTSVLTYGSRSADPTIEDVGEASVINGLASVPLDASFAGTINFAHPYFVFLTPEGDNAGLYVTAKTHRGFVVREARGAHSTLRVQYRIVASPLDDSAATRLPAVAASLTSNTRLKEKFRQIRERDTLARQRLAKLKKEYSARVVRG